MLPLILGGVALAATGIKLKSWYDETKKSSGLEEPKEIINEMLDEMSEKIDAFFERQQQAQLQAKFDLLEKKCQKIQEAAVSETKEKSQGQESNSKDQD